MMDNRTRVKILNREYVLKGTLDADYINGLAEKLNSRVREISQSSDRKLDDLHLLILVALNLLDELSLNEEMNVKEKNNDEVVQKTNRLITMLEKGIIGDID